MNYSTAVMLINQNIRAVRVTYIKDTPKEAPTYLFKTLDKSLEVDDYVVIPTDSRHNMTVAQVVEVDAEVDYESSLPLKWLIDKVNVEGNEKILEEEAKWIETLKASEKTKKQKQLKQDMVDMYQDANIDKLPIATMTCLPTK